MGIIIILMSNIELEEAFKLLDTDGDGKLKEDEFGSLVRCMGYVPTEAAIKEAVKGIGKALTFEEVKKYMSTCKLPKHNKDELVEALHMFDTDGTGEINATQMSHLLQNLGEKL